MTVCNASSGAFCGAARRLPPDLIQKRGFYRPKMSRDTGKAMQARPMILPAIFPLLVVAEAMTAFATLAFELSAPRLVAPYAGASTDTWTAIIAAFLTALAAGSALAGRIAAPGHPSRNLRIAGALCLASGLAMAGTPYILPAWDTLVLAPSPAEPWRIVLFSSVPFLPAGFALGLVTPLIMASALARQSTLHQAAPRRISALYMAGALGSLAGAWTALWFLLDTWGTRFSLGVLALLCILAGLLLYAAARRGVPA